MSWTYDDSYYYGYYIDGTLTDEDTVISFCETHNIDFIHNKEAKEVFIYVFTENISTVNGTYSSGLLDTTGNGFGPAAHPIFTTKDVVKAAPTLTISQSDALTAITNTFTVIGSLQWIDCAHID